ncbi:hypothetical protein [Dyadobacter psychrophilus]|uniref:Uncharacterized protein n=1 Tax=Dyadobacter psychrophilus TaxID=651661 RepID=A0A1T5DAD5_9BACT|nr:hypothetical protein [Dyadobacter psychrophilus]SKB68619.1 hypothetical protein SAMN05660293_01469 [Dyadobacter psychrophilus]
MEETTIWLLTATRSECAFMRETIKMLKKPLLVANREPYKIDRQSKVIMREEKRNFLKNYAGL